MMNKKIIALALCALFSSCTQIDNYVLGKDNTPKPVELAPLTSKVNISQNWSVANGKAVKMNSYLKLKPVVRGDVVYTANSDGTLQALHRKTGQLLWSQHLRNGIVSGPTLGDGYIAVSTNAAHVVVLRQDNGHKVWQARVSSEVLAKVAIADQKVIAKTIDGNLYAFKLQTGEKIWVNDHGSPSLILKASSSPVIVNNIIFVGYADGRLDAVDLNSGHVIWQRSIAYASGSSDVERLVDIDADPIIRGNVAYLATYQGYVGALLLTDGQFIWNKPASVFKNMTMDETSLYFVNSQDVVWALDKQSGQVKWKQIGFKGHSLTEPVRLGKYLIMGDKTGYLHVVDCHTGSMLGRIHLGAAINISPVVAGTQIVVMTANGKLNSLTIG